MKKRYFWAQYTKQLVNLLVSKPFTPSSPAFLFCAEIFKRRPVANSITLRVTIHMYRAFIA